MTSSVAVLSDVHGNAVALEAVLAELAADPPELVVLGGDLTWGPLPHETARLLRELPAPALLVRGNAERALFERRAETPRERWLLEAHTEDDMAFLRRAVEGLTVDVAGLGPVRFCHGSPRSDEELITPGTPEERLAAAVAGRPERVVVERSHPPAVRPARGRHPQRQPGQRRHALCLGAGRLLGRPRAGRGAAPTEYDVERAVTAYRQTGDPLAEQMAEILLSPPTPDEVVADERQRPFAG